MGTSMLPTMICKELELERFRVVAFTGFEELSEPYVFTIDLQSEHDTPPDALDLGKMVGKTATLVLARPDDIEGGQRQINGVIAEASHLGMNSQHMQTWRIELRSPLWLLSLGRHFATFEDMTTADIVTDLLSKYSLTGTLDGCTHQAKRVLQHSESDLDLVQRLLAEEGRAWLTANKAVGDFTFVTAGSHEVLCPDERLVQGAFDPALSDEDRDDDADHFGVVLDFRATRRVTFASVKINAQTPKRYSQVSTSEATVKKRRPSPRAKWRCGSANAPRRWPPRPAVPAICIRSGPAFA